jgi:hypothetical protein
MRTFLLRLLFDGLVATAVFAAPQTVDPRETLWLFTDLTLGKSEQAALAKLAESQSLRKIEPSAQVRATGVTSMWIVFEKGAKEELSGLVEFAAGKLSSVQRDFRLTGGDVEFGTQLYFAMRDLEREGNGHCTIETENNEVPEFANKLAKLHCGKKFIVIDLQKIERQEWTVQLKEELIGR